MQVIIVRNKKGLFNFFNHENHLKAVLIHFQQLLLKETNSTQPAIWPEKFQTDIPIRDEVRREIFIEELQDKQN